MTTNTTVPAAREMGGLRTVTAMGKAKVHSSKRREKRQRFHLRRDAHDAIVPVSSTLDELEADRQDPQWQALLNAARSYRRRLRSESRIS